MNKTNILLINPPCRLPTLIPLGLGYIASVMRLGGYPVEVLDINGFGYPDEKVAEIIRSSDFDIVGIGGLTSTYKYVKWLSGIIKKEKPSVPIIAGNMVSTAHPELLLKNSSVDIAVIDEGELTFKELVSIIETKRALDGVKGVYYKNSDGSITKTPPRERITDLDSLPFPAWDLFPMEIYLNNSTTSVGSFGLRQINISSVRGCPYECTFCSHPFGRKVARRSPKSIISEIKELKRLYNIGYIMFSDDLFLVNEAQVMEFCDMMISERLDIKWAAAGRVNLVNERVLRAMRKAGCVELGYGFESGSQVILDRMKKHVAVKQAEEAISMTRKAGIRVYGSFIFGMPGETRYTMNETLKFIKRTRLPISRFFYATPYPGTELYEIARQMGRLPHDEDAYIESLGEMRTTFLVNLTGFTNKDLVKAKNDAESAARRNFNASLKIELFLQNWQRRYILFLIEVKNKGIGSAVRAVFLRALRKI